MADAYDLADVDNRYEFVGAATEVVCAWFSVEPLTLAQRMARVETAIGDLRDLHPDVAVRESRWDDIDWPRLGVPVDD